MAEKDSIGCYHIVLQDAISSKNADHQFIVEESMKDISLEEMFQKMQQINFVMNVNGVLENMVEISTNDKAFRKTVEESIATSNYHYAVHFFLRKRVW